MFITSKNPSFLNITEGYYNRILEGTQPIEDPVGAPGVNIIPPVQPIKTEPVELSDEDDSNPELDNIIKSFFRDNEKIKDSDIHGLADTLGIDYEEFEGYIYRMLQDYILNDNSESGAIIPDEDDEDSDLEDE